MDMRHVSDADKAKLLKAVKKDFAAMEKKHGEDQVRWAINKITAERSKRRAMEAERKRLEAQLAKLG